MTDVLICEWCGDEFIKPKGRGPVPRFCKPSHRQRAYERRRWQPFTQPGRMPVTRVVYAGPDDIIKIVTITPSPGSTEYTLDDARKHQSYY
jgi:hypothetical protein